MTARRICGGVGCLVVLPILGLAAVRLVSSAGLAESAYIALALALLPLAMLPAYVAVVLGTVARRPVLTGVAVGCVVLHLVWVLPSLPPRDTVPRATPGAFVVLSLNVGSEGFDADGLDGLIEIEQPDVLALQEVKPRYEAALEAVLARHGFADGLLRTDQRRLQGAGLWSRLPVTSTRFLAVPGGLWPEVTVRVGSRDVAIASVHTWPPHSRLRAHGPGSLRQLAAEQQNTPRVLVGDFNAGRDDPAFGELLDSGLRDAMDVRGRGHVGTYPVGHRWVPPVLQLDHILVPDGVGVIDARTARGVRSDHLPVLARLAVG